MTKKINFPPKKWLALVKLSAVLLTSVHIRATTETGLNKTALKEQALEMFKHAYWSYMTFAYPADELMPLSCQGRTRGVTPSRGDVDDCLGNFSLTLVDTLDTLVVVGEYDEFERAVGLVVNNVAFDSDIVVSVFETNIRMIGGLLSAHLMTLLLREKQPQRLKWYRNHLLLMASDLADRLLPAFNTTSGLPYPRVNLRHGISGYLRDQKDTCTACGGTMILEMATLSRLTGNPVYEQKARKAMDFLWQQRHRGSDLMGTVLNVHNGHWVRRDSGIGAGIDSYYEYCLKAYILLGDELYLDRFNKHYDAVMRYVNKGPLFVDVHMHKPLVASRPFMDSLLAFWPGLQVLKGDLKPAIEIHEMLNQVVQKHRFLPEAFTHDFQVHWAQHPLRPEFTESTYFLYRATKDEHYLEVAKQIMDSLNEHVRVSCGFAGVKDVRNMAHEDRMDSFVLAETFKYLYMIFAEPGDLLFDPDSYVFTTEAHFLPLNIGEAFSADGPRRRHFIDPRPQIIDEDENEDENEDEDKNEDENESKITGTLPHACPNNRAMRSYARKLRLRVRSVIGELAGHLGLRLKKQQEEEQRSCSARPSPLFEKSVDSTESWLKASDFSVSNVKHVTELNRMGIRLHAGENGRLQLTHDSTKAESVELAAQGVVFMQQMIVLTREEQEKHNNEESGARTDRIIQLISAPYFGRFELVAFPAQFGLDFEKNPDGIFGHVQKTVPYRACSKLTNAAELMGKIAIAERSDCMFQEKARFAQQAGAIGLIVIDHYEDSSMENSPAFAMSGDDKIEEDNIGIAVVFLFRIEGEMLLENLKTWPRSVLRIGQQSRNPQLLFSRWLKTAKDGPNNAICTSSFSKAPNSKIGAMPNFGNEKDLSTTTTTTTKWSLLDGNLNEEFVCFEKNDKEVVCISNDRNHFKDEQNLVKNYLRNNEAKIFNVKFNGQTDQPVLVYFNCDLLTDQMPENLEKIGEIVNFLAHCLSEQTNLAQLEKANGYLTAFKKLIYQALNVHVQLSQADQSALIEMAKTVKSNKREQEKDLEKDGKKFIQMEPDLAADEDSYENSKDLHLRLRVLCRIDKATRIDCREG